MNALCWNAGSLCLLTFLGICLSHLILLIRRIRKGIHCTYIPFIGGVAGTIGLLLLPVAQVHWLWWLPLGVDIGSLPLAIATVIFQLRRSARQPPDLP